jgi:hypothetical protein
MNDRENFEKWFASPIEKMLCNPSAGFALVLTAFPLLERYVTRRCRAKDGSDCFYVELQKMFSEAIADKKAAKRFWHGYRNKILHEVTIEQRDLLLSDRGNAALETMADGSVRLHPALFARRVVDTIRGDFDTFASGLPLASVVTVTVRGTGSGRE